MKHRPKFLIGALAAVGLALVLALIASGGQVSLAEEGIFYVDADASGADDGSSWVDAYTDLQDALDAASAGDQIWVAAGTYKPTVQHGGTGDRYMSFQMKKGVAIYGGFDPTAGATEWNDRNWALYETILSGDIGTEEDSSDNVYHVFYHPDGTNLDRSAILDGFTISDGNANGGTWPHWDGGGMYNDASSPVLTNCTFAGNSSTYGGGGMSNWAFSSPLLTNCTFEGNWSNASGGGMFSDSSSPVLIDCIFSGNWAEDSGGGMHNTWDSPAELINCTFEGNSANQNGGGMFNYGSSPLLIDCTFEDNSAGNVGGGVLNIGSSPTLAGCTFVANSADSRGGGMYNDLSSPALTHCSFAGNLAADGGGMYNEESSPVLSICAFSGNSAHWGGGMSNNYNSSPALADCAFSDNSAFYDGGGLSNYGSSSPELTNCSFVGNSAGEEGGGIHNYSSSSPLLTNCTFSGNSANYGGGMYNSGSSPILTNCILWGDTSEIHNDNSSATVTYSDVQGGYAGEGNIDAEPGFVDLAGGDFHLAPDSPCIDTGDNLAPNLALYDFEGDPRRLDGNNDGEAKVDMGVDEFVYSAPIPVDIDVKPKSRNNVINLGSRSAVPVAILTAVEFDAGNVDPSTILFAGAAPVRWAMEDADKDGDLDLLCTFEIQELELTSSTEATLHARTLSGFPIEGTDQVKVKE